MRGFLQSFCSKSIRRKVSQFIRLVCAQRALWIELHMCFFSFFQSLWYKKQLDLSAKPCLSEVASLSLRIESCCFLRAQVSVGSLVASDRESSFFLQGWKTSEVFECRVCSHPQSSPELTTLNSLMLQAWHFSLSNKILTCYILIIIYDIITMSVSLSYWTTIFCSLEHQYSGSITKSIRAYSACSLSRLGCFYVCLKDSPEIWLG